MSDRNDDPHEPTEEPDDEPNDDTGDAAKAAAILGGVFAIGALALYGPRAALSVVVGAVIAVANLLTMRAIIHALVRVPSEEDERAGKTTSTAASIGWALLAAFKILIIFGGIWFLLTRRLVDPMPLVVGYGVLPLGIAGSAIWSSIRQSR